MPLIATFPDTMPAHIKTSQKVGRPPSSRASRLKARLWYYAVRHRTQLSDYRLGLLALEQSGQKIERGQQRPRIFEAIRKKGVLPSNGLHPRRSFDLVALVETWPTCRGTSYVIHSPLWELAEGSWLGMEATESILRKCMIRTGVQRETDGRYFEGLSSRYLYDKNRVITRSSNFESSLHKYLMWFRESPTLSVLALFGALYRHAYLTCALEEALLLKNHFLILLNRYCENHWLREISEELYLVLAGSILNITASPGGHRPEPSFWAELPLSEANLPIRMTRENDLVFIKGLLEDI